MLGMLGKVDFFIIIAYIAATVTIGLCFRGKQDDANDYFASGGRMTSWFQNILVGLSLAAALFSGISFLAYPSIVYQYGITILFGLACFPIALLILHYFFLPHLLTKTGVKHPYDIIENKFGPHVRTLAASLYMLLRIGWMATLIYAPTVAIMAAGGLDSRWFWPIIMTIGLASTIYTTLGGITSIIITDAFQFLVIILGIGLTVVFIIFRIDIPSNQIMDYLKGSGLLKIQTSTDLSLLITIWSVVIGTTINNLANYTADQMSIQRYLAAGTARSAERSFVFNMFGAVIVLFLLAAVGLLLSSWYHFHPNESVASLPADKVFPYFIASHLPAGIGGLLMAALLAATISSMTGGINTLAATLTFDFWSRFRANVTAKNQLRFGQVMSFVVGIASTLIAGFVNRLGSIFEITTILLGLFAGPLCVCVLMCVTRYQFNRLSVGAAMLLGALAGGCVTFSDNYGNLWVGPMSFASTLIVSIAGTLVFGPDKENISAASEIAERPLSKNLV